MSHPSKRTKEEMYPLIESYFDSGLTQRQFYSQHELPEHIFIYWLRHYRRHQKEKSFESFHPILVNGGISCQFNLPGGVTLRLEGLSAKSLASFLTVLSGN